jgi:Zn-finger nucleic acid-binding protein
MNSLQTPEMCPRCQTPHLKRWSNLNDEQKFLAERLPLSAEYSRDEREKHRYCTMCWFEQAEQRSELA